MRSWCVLLAAVVASLAGSRARAQELCSTCELQLGFGTTYHFWSYTHSIVLPIAFNFDHDHWELAAFRFAKQQEYYSDTFGAHVVWATPYWGGSFTRRLEVVRLEHFKVFLGLGAAYKTQENRQVASLWTFSEQLGMRYIPREGCAIELVGRHWSNAGLKLPNHGQDFVTVMFAVYPGLFHF